MRFLPLVLLCACLPPRVALTGAPPAPDARQALSARFRAAVDARRFDEVHALLSNRWRDRYTAERLQADFDREPLARERSQRELSLVEEAGEWKVDSLE